MKRKIDLLPLFLLLVLAGCRTTGGFIVPEPVDPEEEMPADSALAYTIYLLGDAGGSPPDGTAAPLRLLGSYLENEQPNSAVVFLGDNIYESGLPPVTSPDRELAEHRINEQIEILKEFPGQVVFIPGNHDWGGEGMGGSVETLRRQEEYIEAALDSGNVFLPDNGFPGPVEVELSDDLLLVALDTQWWLESVKTYGDTGQYELEQEGEFLIELHYVLDQHEEKDKIIVAHHPLFSISSHGGIIPLEGVMDPVEFFIRRFLGTPQDLSNHKYRRLRQGMLDIFSRHDGLIYAAGHDHNLQYFQHGNQHYIVSGSGSKLSPVSRGRGSAFTAAERGFSILRYYTDGSIWIEFVASREDGRSGETLYLNRIREGDGPLIAYVSPEETEELIAQTTDSDGDPAGPDPDDTKKRGTDGHAPGTNGEVQEPYAFYSTGTVAVSAGEGYQVGSLGKFFLGERYREVWETPITVPIIDLEHTAGGLTPLKVGGGLQTKSLRLIGGDGDEYVLRAIEKDPSRSIPEFLRRTVAQDVVQDQASAMHPYGAFVLPDLARAAGIFHTYPTLVVIPDSERLGRYRGEFAGMLALFEVRADEDQSDEARFGYAENVIGTPKLFENLVEDNDERVDERSFVRARLFDMLIGDWDRHKDQWRWSEFDVTPGKYFQPIPRDRDFAFFKFDGLIARLAKWSGIPAFKRFTLFNEHFGDLTGLNFNGAALDRRLTSSLTRDDWIQIADSIRAGVTDQVIEEAIRQWPEPIYDYHGEEIIRILKVRRDKLPEIASDYYDILARTVDVVGSDKHERFEVTRLDDDRTEVVMYKTKKEGDVERELFRRVFFTGETEEVRLYGLDGNDQFIVTGEVRKGIRVRAIGGQGPDRFVDQSRVRGRSNMTYFYDTEAGNEFEEAGPQTRIERSNDPYNNTYEMLRYEQDLWQPVLTFDQNSTDGFIFGGGVRFFKSGFRKSPYAARHALTVDYGTGSKRFGADYSGRFTEIFGKWSASLDAEAVDARDFKHFYGLGNETRLSNQDFFNARVGQVLVDASLYQNVLPFSTFQFGPTFSLTTVDSLPGRPPTAFSHDDFIDKYYAGAFASFEVDGTDTLAATQSGMRWHNRLDLNVGVRNTNDVFARLTSELSYFYTFFHPELITLGVRFGGAVNIGDFSFYQANTLGGQVNLRGYHRNRFAGRSAAYLNTDLRVRLFDFNAYLTRGEGGLLGFADVGRVWADNEESGKWHPGTGIGLWLTPFYQLVVTGTVEFSPESTLFDVSLGFLF